MLSASFSDDGVCICLSVPDASWESPLREMAQHYGRPVQVLFRDAGARRAADASVVSSLATGLHLGAALICASQDAKTGIPPEFRSVADAVLRLRSPAPDEITKVIADLRGTPVTIAPPRDLGQGLALDEVVACLRQSENPETTFARLRRAQDAKSSSVIDMSGPRLKDLAGFGQAAEWATRLREDMGAFKEGRLAWRRLDARAILHGPPGTGKSLFPSALARSLGVGCIRTSVGQWFTTHAGDLGQTIKAAATAFEEARAAVRTHGGDVLFLDEVDGLPDRAALEAREGSWWRPLVNFVLATLDGSGSDLDGIVLIAATNDIGAVDPALLRPGRFGTHFAVMPPDLHDLTSILVLHLGGASTAASSRSTTHLRIAPG